jgi:hypothetical protein
MVCVMPYTLAAAATATGLNKTTILKAIKDGKLAGSKDERGEWLVEPAELHQLYPPATERAGGDAIQRYAAADVEALSAQIEALLRQAGARLRQQAEDVRRDHDAGHIDELELADQHQR